VIAKAIAEKLGRQASGATLSKKLYAIHAKGLIKRHRAPFLKSSWICTDAGNLIAQLLQVKDGALSIEEDR